MMLEYCGSSFHSCAWVKAASKSLEAKRLKTLEDENAKLKKLLAEQMLDLAAMKELVSKKW